VTDRIESTAADCAFYHSINLPISGPQTGEWDLRGRFDDYTGHVPLAGKTVLDVGTASGFLTFEAEQRGATVTSFDVAHPGQWATLPFPDIEPSLAGRDLERQKNSYWLAHREFGSKAQCVYGDVYDLSPELAGSFDVALVGQTLVHLRDAISALAAVASVCRETLVVVEGSLEGEYPVAWLCARAARPDLDYVWYQYSHGWYREVLAILGFLSVEITTDVYRCNHPLHEREIELATVVATRR
jgi:SAM-dependent methyltransferase